MNKIELTLEDVLDIYSDICKKHRVENYYTSSYTELRVIEDESIYPSDMKSDNKEDLENKFFDATYFNEEVSVCYMEDLIICYYKHQNYLPPHQVVEIKNEHMKFIGSVYF